MRFAKAMGFRVVGLDVSANARRVAESHGADATADATADSANGRAIRAALASIGAKSLDAAMVAAGVGAAYASAFEHTGFNGYDLFCANFLGISTDLKHSTIITIGVPHSAIEVDILQFVKKNLRLQGTQSCNPLELKQMIRFVETHRIIPEVALSKLEQVPDLMEVMAEGKATSKIGISFA